MPDLSLEKYLLSIKIKALYTQAQKRKEKSIANVLSAVAIPSTPMLSLKKI